MLVGTFNRKHLVEAFSRQCETSWRFVDSSYMQTELYSNHTLATTATSGPFIPNLHRYLQFNRGNFFQKWLKWLPSQYQKSSIRTKLPRRPRAAPARHSPLPAKTLTNKTALHCIRLHNTKYIYIYLNLNLFETSFWYWPKVKTYEARVTEWQLDRRAHLTPIFHGLRKDSGGSERCDIDRYFQSVDVKLYEQRTEK